MVHDSGEEYYQSETVAEEYDEKRFSGQGGSYIRRMEREAFLSLLPELKGKKVLDVATGTGRLAIDMARAGADVTAADISEEMVKKAQAKSERQGIDIDYFVSNAEDLPFEESSFDIVTSQRFLHLVPDHRPYLEEWTRVGTEALVYDYFNMWSMRLFYDWALPMESYLHRPSRIRSILTELGVENIEEERRMFIPYGAIRHRTGPHVTALIKINNLMQKLDIANSVVYVRADIMND
ncbi:MAG: class I SAM-dependent methyltransferase [Candidatus Aenigmatarchaeota archaeon]